MGTYEDRMNDIREERNYNASHATGEEATICAYLGFDETLFNINLSLIQSPSPRD